MENTQKSQLQSQKDSGKCIQPSAKGVVAELTQIDSEFYKDEALEVLLALLKSISFEMTPDALYLAFSSVKEKIDRMTGEKAKRYKELFTRLVLISDGSNKTNIFVKNGFF